MTACPIRYQRQVSDRKGKIFYTSITSLSHISKLGGQLLGQLAQYFFKSVNGNHGFRSSLYVLYHGGEAKS